MGAGGGAMKTYTGYIAAAYAFAAVVVGFLVAKIALDYRELKKKLSRVDDEEKRP
jgi:heme exporter protein CcmD